MTVLKIPSHVPKFFCYQPQNKRNCFLSQCVSMAGNSLSQKNKQVLKGIREATRGLCKQ